MKSKVTLSVLIAITLALIITILALIIKASRNISVKVVSSVNSEIAYYNLNKYENYNEVTYVKDYDGYTYEGSYLDPNFKESIDSSYFIKGDVTVFIHYVFNEYQIFYHNVDGLVNNNPTSYTLNSPTIELLDVTKGKYKFLGWFDNDDLVSRVLIIDTNAKQDINLYAKFSLVTYDTYNINIYLQDRYGLYEKDTTIILDIDSNQVLSSLFDDSIYYYENYHYSHISIGLDHLNVYYDLDTYTITIIDSITSTVVNTISDIVYGSTVILPAIVEIPGYSLSYYTDNALFIVSDTIIYINREPLSNIAYTINHITLDANGLEVDVISEIQYGVAGSTAVIGYKEIAGYTHEGGMIYVIISGNGTTVVNVYYKEA
ncbi:MAG: InlB B-repeat-containing protein [Acholeplasmatales bacterium]|jgi:hypothetical protein|nr:InlB B-repeat-containing protein [Acholeplasmatales bacterium]